MSTNIPFKAGSASNLFVSSGSVGVTGTNYVYNNNNMNTGITAIQSTLRVNGDADIDGDLKVKGQSITETLNKINERLNILIPNEKLEREWERLAELRRQYVELERKLLEQQQVFDILKKCD